MTETFEVVNMQNHQENQCYVSNFLFFLGSSNFYFKNVTQLSSAF